MTRPPAVRDGLAHAVLRSAEVSPETRSIALEVERASLARWRRWVYAQRRRMPRP